MKSLFLGLLLILFSSCSSTDEKLDDSAQAEAIYKKAQEQIEDERYIIAAQNLSRIKDEFPYSKYAAQAQLELANVYFLQEDFEAAFSQYTVVRDLYPRHEMIEYVIFRQGESLYQSLPATIDRDLTNAPKAIKYYQEVLELYPNGKYTKEAKEGIEKARNKLLEKEDYIGNYYFIRDFWPQSFERYKNLRETFPNSRLDDKALYRMIVSLQKQNKDAGSLIAELKSKHPNSDYADDVN